MRNSIFYKEVQIPKPSDIFIDPDKREEGELIETKVSRIVDLKEPITDTAPYIETPEADGVIAEFDIRTDKFEEALDTVTNMYRSKEKVNSQNFVNDISDELSSGNGLEGGDSTE